MAIVAAGPVFNLVLALIMFCSVYLISGIDIILPTVGQVTEDSPAQQAGFLKGDLIAAIEGEKIESWHEIKERVKDKAGIPLSVTVKRNEQYLGLTVIPEQTIVKNEFGEDIKSSLIGIVAAGDLDRIDIPCGRETVPGRGVNKDTGWPDTYRSDDRTDRPGKYRLPHPVHGHHQHQFRHIESFPNSYS